MREMEKRDSTSVHHSGDVDHCSCRGSLRFDDVYRDKEPGPGMGC